MRQTQAHASLIEALRRAQSNEEKLILVVTGKGSAKSSKDEEIGILRRMVPHWLAAPELRSIVLGFEPASAIHGGDGALYVRIRRKRDHE
jgi:DNA-nicking Smr family endonuclease